TPMVTRSSANVKALKRSRCFGRVYAAVCLVVVYASLAKIFGAACSRSIGVLSALMVDRVVPNAIARARVSSAWGPATDAKQRPGFPPDPPIADSTAL